MTQTQNCEMLLDRYVAWKYNSHLDLSLWDTQLNIYSLIIFSIPNSLPGVETHEPQAIGPNCPSSWSWGWGNVQSDMAVDKIQRWINCIEHFYISTKGDRWKILRHFSYSRLLPAFQKKEGAGTERGCKHWFQQYGHFASWSEDLAWGRTRIEACYIRKFGRIDWRARAHA